MNSTIIKLFCAVVFLALAGRPAHTQNSASATATANADVVCGIAIVNQSNLYFGTIVGGTGTAHVTAAGSESYTGNINAGSNSGSHAAAQFYVTGQSGFSYAITRIPASGLLTVTDGAGHSAPVQLDGEVAASGTLGLLTSCGGTGGTGPLDIGGDINHGNDGHGGTGGNGGEDNGNHGEGNNGHHNDTTDQSISIDGGGCCGTQTFNVGGVITLNGTQTPGNYSNANSGGTTWVETVTYN